MIKYFGLNHKSRTTAIVLLGAILILLASASAVLATQVTFIKEHHPPATFQLLGSDAYQPGTNVTFHLHLNVSSSSPPGANLDITNLTITDILPPGLTYVPNSQISAPVAAPGFSIAGQTLMWNWSSAVLSTGAAPPLPGMPANLFFTASVAFNVSIDASTPDMTLKVNNAIASYKEVLTQTVSSPSTTDTIIIARPVLNLVKIAPAKVENGSSFNYTIQLKNTGHVDAIGVTVQDNLTAGLIITPTKFAIATSGVTTTVFSTPPRVIWNGDIGNVTGANTVNITIPVTLNTTASSIVNFANYTSVPSSALLNSTASTLTTTTTIIHPAIMLTKTPSPTTNQTAPATFTFTYNVTNIGDVTLTGVNVFDQTFNVKILGPITLAPGASAVGTFTQTYNTTGTFTNTANATGTDQTGVSVTARANATVTIIPPPSSATRTIGFWQTHTNFTEWVFTNKLGGTIPIDTNSSHARNINTFGKLFGAFYASIPKNSDGTKRDQAIDQARMILLQQLVGAILNHAASGVVVPIDPVTGKDLITAGNMAYSGNNSTEILRIEGLLDSFNGSGDGIAFPPGTPDQGNATPQLSKDIANIPFWDSPL